jgi:hypothetical protein
MSESPDVAEFEAARAEAMGDDGHEDAHVADAGHQETEGDDGASDEPAPKNWEKIAQDKEAALAAERSRRKAEAKRARDLEERFARLEAQSKGAQVDPFEDLAAKLREDDEDPIGDINGLKAVVRQFIAAQKADREQEQSQTQRVRQFQAITSSMSEAESDFAADHPDYFDAASHYRTERQAELEALGYAGEGLQRQLAQDLIGVVHTAISQGRDPAETVYNLAKRRGFASGASQAADKLQKLADSSRAGARPVSKPAGGGSMTAGSVAGLNGAAFDAAFAKLRQQERRAK